MRLYLMMNKNLTIVDSFLENNQVRDDIFRVHKELGWDVQQVSSVSSEDIAEGKDLDDIFTDFVLWRGLGNNSDYEGVRIKYILNRSNRVCVNTNEIGVGIGTLSSNKYFQQGIFLRDDLLKDHTLPAYQAFSLEYVEKLINKGKITYPFAIKDVYGSLGKEITLVRNHEELMEIDFTDSWKLMVQKYVDEQYNYRVFVIGGVPFGAMRKQGAHDDPGDFEAKSGGVVREKEEDPELLDRLHELAVRAAKISRLQYAGVDIVKTEDDKLYIIETNISAGWSNGYCEITGWDLPKEILLYFEAMGLMKFDGKSEGEAREIMERRREELSLQKIPWYGKIDVSKFK